MFYSGLRVSTNDTAAHFTRYEAHNKGPSVKKELENYIEGDGNIII
jgi:hypothetical protein